MKAFKGIKSIPTYRGGGGVGGGIVKGEGFEPSMQ
jgi:hypothetical protein